MLITENGLEVLSLSGAPHDMGRVHGTLLREKIHLAVRDYLGASEEAFSLPRALLYSMAKSAEPHIPEEYIEEMQAVATAAKVPYEDILVLNCLPDIHNSLARGQSQCCNFVLFGPATTTGGLIHGRNLDFPHLGIIPRCSTVICRRPSHGSRLATVSICWAGFVGTLTGMSSAGVSAAEVDSMAVDSGMNGTPVGFMLRKGLETCRGLDSFAQLVQDSRRGAGFNIALADGNIPDSRALEFTAHLFESRDSRKGCLVVDNPCLCADTSRMRIGYYWGAFRHARLAELIRERFGRVDISSAIDMLRDRYDIALSSPRGRSFRCICNSETVQSVVMLPGEARMFVAHGTVPAPLGTYRELNLRKFWCEDAISAESAN